MYKFERTLNHYNSRRKVGTGRPARPVAGRDEKGGARLNKTVGSKRKNLFSILGIKVVNLPFNSVLQCVC